MVVVDNQYSIRVVWSVACRLSGSRIRHDDPSAATNEHEAIGQDGNVLCKCLQDWVSRSVFSIPARRKGGELEMSWRLLCLQSPKYNYKVAILAWFCFRSIV